MICNVMYTQYTQVPCCSYEEERLPRVKTMHIKGFDGSSTEDKEKYMYKPTFKPLWRTQVCPWRAAQGSCYFLHCVAACVCCRL